MSRASSALCLANVKEVIVEEMSEERWDPFQEGVPVFSVRIQDHNEFGGFLDNPSACLQTCNPDFSQKSLVCLQR